MSISIAIPTYEMHNLGVEYLSLLFESLDMQDYKDFDVVVSDDSKDNKIEQYCKYMRYEFPLTYIHNNNKGLSSNTNNAIKNCKGNLIKILCQDDHLWDHDSLRKTVENFNFNKNWLVSAYYYAEFGGLKKLYTPQWNNRIYLNNTLGTHSCLTILNDKPLNFDENLMWYMDCEYYYQLYKRYGLPQILTDPTVIQLIWSGQVTNTLITDEVINREQNYIRSKYKVI